MFRALQSRLPDFKEILPVYAVLVFFLFGWATIAFFWKLPAWLFYLNLGEVGVIYLYTAFTEFFESLIYLGVLLIFCGFLPAHFLKDRFAVRGTITAIALPGFILLTNYIIAIQKIAPALSALAAFVICGGLAFAWIWLSSRYIVFEQTARFLVERTPVFLYVYAPIVIISLIVVLVRNVG